MSPVSRVALAATLVLPFPAGASAQDIPLAVPTPTVEPVPVVTPTPVATPTPVPTSTPTPREAPTPRPAPTARPTPVERPTPAVRIAPTPGPLPSATIPAPSASPGATPPGIVAPLPTATERRHDRPRWPWMMGAAAVVLGGIGLWLSRRRQGAAEKAALAAEPAVAFAPVAERGALARLTLAFRPSRVGFNMLSVTVEGELTIANDGDAAATDVRVRAALFGAHAEQDAEIAAFAAEPIVRPVVAPFVLAPGERRTVRVVAAIARAGMRTMTAADRPMFVPVLAVNVRTAGEGRVAQGYVVGVERVDSAKLAPFWLDVPDRAYTAVAARAHGAALER